MAELCGGCDLPSWEIFGKFHGQIPGNSANALQFLREHGVLPSRVWCPRCGVPCHLRKDSPRWYCSSYTVDKNSRKRIRCNFSISDYKDTFFERAHVEPWKVVLFVNHWLRKHWDHAEVINNLKFSTETSVQWRKNCSLVTETWLERQEAIGGHGVVVEIDRKLVWKRRPKEGKSKNQVWVFGGIERQTKRSFVIPFIDKIGREAVLPAITENILPGSVVACGAWGASLPLQKLGYTLIIAQEEEEEDGEESNELHALSTPKTQEVKEEARYNLFTPKEEADTPDTHPFTHTLTNSITEESNTPDTASAHLLPHTHTIRELWQDLKDWVRRPGMRSEYLKEYISRFLFIRHHKEQHLHHFFTEVAHYFPPHAHLTKPDLT
ncbi:uncharacterized protein LOC123505164 [Portunus trituberculatus]|uniref:uncharacterized protein LOC123505164 n=1 Tax=Portunus trituberculatus TaxID=210409 RepID=UPI001E1D06E1|nr:uncharacterized protein LOC123505164 [Portunus trituberculatus]XP_045112262.1 uncharacterized protein LOC123505164 [Portunus trituberculatus]XP_045112269.1 uncharacterized protein LOC123505164 [Portunus trituberculatus]XP_045112276.1 uncharacterized protein LOC123505164 [Portunus trituberculatus]